MSAANTTSPAHLDAARAAHQAAIARHGELVAATATKRSEVARLEGERGRLISRAAKGEAVGPRDLAAADKVIGDAHRAETIATAMRESAFKDVEVAEIERLHAEAAEISRTLGSSNSAIADAIGLLQERITAARDALDQLRAAAFQGDIAKNAARLFNSGIEQAVHNATLHAMHSSHRPRVDDSGFGTVQQEVRRGKIELIDGADLDRRPVDLGRLAAEWLRRTKPDNAV